jgi:hypothetical protein
MLDEYLIFTDHNFENTPFFMVGLKKCGRVTNYKNNKI